MIPSWNMAGVLPPVWPGELGHSPNRSPYAVTLANVVEYFSGSAERIAILEGLLAYRAALHQLNIVEGFQWLDGSFMENVEMLESRQPKDMDVVTFFRIPTGQTQATLVFQNTTLFVPEQTKQTFSVDAYPFILGEPTESRHVKQISYWYSMWSHRRGGTWKGFFQMDLAPQADLEAKLFLASVKNEKGFLS